MHRPIESRSSAGGRFSARPKFSAPRVALVHYWLVTNRGGERVLERFSGMFPNADIFTHVHDKSVDFGSISNHRIQTTFINKLPWSRKFYQRYLPLMPMALEELDLTGYDLIISSEAGPAKGVTRHPDAYQICYTHSPMRYLWDQYSVYRKNFGFASRMTSPMFFSYLRTWDFASAQRVDDIIANSAFVSRRIEHVWRRDSSVIHPPVATADFMPSGRPAEDYYLWVGQLVPYKCPQLAVDACTRLGRPLVVVGVGPMLAYLKKRAGPTIRFVDRMSFTDLKRTFTECRALLFTGAEDFGITPVEVMASGRPVIALGQGGAIETVDDGQTGRFFFEATTEATVEAILEFEDWLPEFNPEMARERAMRFAPERFDDEIREFLSSKSRL